MPGYGYCIDEKRDWACSDDNYYYTSGGSQSGDSTDVFLVGCHSAFWYVVVLFCSQVTGAVCVVLLSGYGTA
jgi:hypothetical protein